MDGCTADNPARLPNRQNTMSAFLVTWMNTEDYAKFGTRLGRERQILPESHSIGNIK